MGLVSTVNLYGCASLKFIHNLRNMSTNQKFAFDELPIWLVWLLKTVWEKLNHTQGKMQKQWLAKVDYLCKQRYDPLQISYLSWGGKQIIQTNKIKKKSSGRKLQIKDVISNTTLFWSSVALLAQDYLIISQSIWWIS